MKSRCSSIESGAIIDLSRRALGAEQVPEIVTTVRQQTEREREIVGLFREGRAREALDMKIADGTAEMVWGGRKETIERVAKLYAERLLATGTAPSVSAPTNRDAHEISMAVRWERRAMGLLGPDQKRIRIADPDGGETRMALAVGDRVRLFKSTGARFTDGRAGNIGRNGSVLEVVALDDKGMTARSMKTGREGWISWPSLADKAGRHAAGLWRRADDPHVAGQHGRRAHPGTSRRQPVGQRLAGRTGGTRHRRQSFLVVPEAAERMEVSQRRPLNDRREVDADDKWANVARNFAYQPKKDLAVDMIGQVRSPPPRIGALVPARPFSGSSSARYAASRLPCFPSGATCGGGCRSRRRSKGCGSGSSASRTSRTNGFGRGSEGRWRCRIADCAAASGISR